MEGEILGAQRTVIDIISHARAAVGLANVPVAGVISGTPDPNLDINDGEAITNAVATDATTVVSSVLNTEADAFLLRATSNIAFLADQLDEAVANANVITTIVGPFDLGDLGAAPTTNFFTMPVSGRITALRAVVTVVIGAGDETITLEIEGSAVTGASLVIDGAAAVGTQWFDAFSGVIAPGAANSNYIAKGQQIELVGDSNSADNGEALLYVEITETQEDTTTLVAGFGDDAIDFAAI